MSTNTYKTSSAINVVQYSEHFNMKEYLFDKFILVPFIRFWYTQAINDSFGINVKSFQIELN